MAGPVEAHDVEPTFERGDAVHVEQLFHGPIKATAHQDGRAFYAGVFASCEEDHVDVEVDAGGGGGWQGSALAGNGQQRVGPVEAFGLLVPQLRNPWVVPVAMDVLVGEAEIRGCTEAGVPDGDRVAHLLDLGDDVVAALVEGRVEGLKVAWRDLVRGRQDFAHVGAAIACQAEQADDLVVEGLISAELDHCRCNCCC